jgi:hypothetical protein
VGFAKYEIIMWPFNNMIYNTVYEKFRKTPILSSTKFSKFKINSIKFLLQFFNRILRQFTTQMVNNQLLSRGVHGLITKNKYLKDLFYFDDRYQFNKCMIPDPH